MVAEALWNSFSQWVTDYFGWGVDPATLLFSTVFSFLVLMILFTVSISRLEAFKEYSGILSLILTITIIASSWYTKSILWLVNALNVIAPLTMVGMILILFLLVAFIFVSIFRFGKGHKLVTIVFFIIVLAVLTALFGWVFLIAAMVIGILCILVGYVASKRKKKKRRPSEGTSPGKGFEPAPEEGEKFLDLAKKIHKLQVELNKRRNMARYHGEKGTLNKNELEEIYKYLSRDFFNPLVKIYKKSGFPFTERVRKHLEYSRNRLVSFMEEFQKTPELPTKDQRKRLWKDLSEAFYYLNEACTQMIQEIHAKMK